MSVNFHGKAGTALLVKPCDACSIRSLLQHGQENLLLARRDVPRYAKEVAALQHFYHAYLSGAGCLNADFCLPVVGF